MEHCALTLGIIDHGLFIDIYIYIYTYRGKRRINQQFGYGLNYLRNKRGDVGWMVNYCLTHMNDFKQ